MQRNLTKHETKIKDLKEEVDSITKKFYGPPDYKTFIKIICLLFLYISISVLQWQYLGKEVYWKTNIVIIISISVIMNGLKHRKYQKEVKKAEKELIKEFGNPLHVANEEQIVAEEAPTA